MFRKSSKENINPYGNLNASKGLNFLTALKRSAFITVVIFLLLTALLGVTGFFSRYMVATFYARLATAAVVIFVVLLVIQKLIPQDKLKSLSRVGVVLSVIWMALFSAVNCYRPTQYLGNDFIMGAAIFAFFSVFAVIISRLQKLKKAALAIYSLLALSIVSSCIVFTTYLLIYHERIDLYIFLSIIETNLSEATEYISQNIPIPAIIGLSILLIAVFYSVFVYTDKVTSEKVQFNASSIVAVIFVCIFTWFFGYQSSRVFPLSLYKDLYRADGRITAFKALNENMDSNTAKIKINDDANLSSEKTPGTIIVVMGESATRDRMKAFTPSFTKENTPWENSMLKNKNFIFFPKAYSCFPNTIMAVTMAFTNRNQYNGVQLKDSVDIVDIAKKAGYRTAWLSTQDKGGIGSAGNSLIAERSDKTAWVQDFDGKLLDELKKLPKNGNNFVVLHIMGSHGSYKNRIPSDMKHLLGGGTDKISHYDRTVLYTDKVLQDVYDYASQNMNLQAMVYLSDHAEDMKYQHTSSPFFYTTVRIPLWIYLSPEYQRAYPEKIAAFRKNSDKVFTNDTTFDLVTGILHGDCNFYAPEYDLGNDNYKINMGNALTLYGKHKVSDDPVFKK